MIINCPIVRNDQTFCELPKVDSPVLMYIVRSFIGNISLFDGYCRSEVELSLEFCGQPFGGESLRMCSTPSAPWLEYDNLCGRVSAPPDRRTEETPTDFQNTGGWNAANVPVPLFRIFGTSSRNVNVTLSSDLKPHRPYEFEVLHTKHKLKRKMMII
jgi:hypothetical protein